MSIICDTCIHAELIEKKAYYFKGHWLKEAYGITRIGYYCKLKHKNIKESLDKCFDKQTSRLDMFVKTS